MAEEDVGRAGDKPSIWTKMMRPAAKCRLKLQLNEETCEDSMSKPVLKP